MLDLLKTRLRATPLLMPKDGEKFLMMVTINIFSVHQKIADKLQGSLEICVLEWNECVGMSVGG